VSTSASSLYRPLLHACAGYLSSFSPSHVSWFILINSVAIYALLHLNTIFCPVFHPVDHQWRENIESVILILALSKLDNI